MHPTTNTETNVTIHDHATDDGPPFSGTCTRCFAAVTAAMRAGHEVYVEARAGDATTLAVIGRVTLVGRFALTIERRARSTVVRWERVLRFERVGGVT